MYIEFGFIVRLVVREGFIRSPEHPSLIPSGVHYYTCELRTIKEQGGQTARRMEENVVETFTTMGLHVREMASAAVEGRGVDKLNHNRLGGYDEVKTPLHASHSGPIAAVAYVAASVMGMDDKLSALVDVRAGDVVAVAGVGAGVGADVEAAADDVAAVEEEGVGLGHVVGMTLNLVAAVASGGQLEYEGWMIAHHVPNAHRP